MTLPNLNRRNRYEKKGRSVKDFVADVNADTEREAVNTALFNEEQIKYILKNPVYTGDLIYQKSYATALPEEMSLVSLRKVQEKWNN